jgi:hypothetical protein
MILECVSFSELGIPFRRIFLLCEMYMTLCQSLPDEKNGTSDYSIINVRHVRHYYSEDAGNGELKTYIKRPSICHERHSDTEYLMSNAFNSI